jgi:hypothetical protein
MANRRFIDFPIASTVGDNDIILIWQDGLNKQTTKATILTGISQDLASLTDVDLTGLTNGQILRYNSVTSKWENTDQGNLDLNDLNDVTIVSPSNGQVLVYNSSTSKWENSSGGYVPYIGAVTTVDLGAQQLQAGHTTLTTNGSTETLTINHTSGSGKAINVTKGGAGEGLYVNKTSGSGNAATIVGTLEATTLKKTGGTSSQFLKADGSVDSTTYQNTADKGQPNGYASLDGNGKVPLTQINDALIGNVNFQGLWNASTNTPTLVDPPSSGTKGYYYIVSTGGTFAGITFEVGDWIISNGTAWGKVDNTDAVSSVFGRTGNVVASNGDYNTSQVTESGNLYYTDARSRAALSFAAGSGAYNSGTGVITIPTNNNQITNGAGYITSAALAGYLPLTGGTLTGALGGTSISLSGDITANRYRGVNSLVLNSYTTVNPSSNVYLYSPLNDRDAWIYLDSADPTSNWGIYHRQIDTAVSGLPGNSIAFVGGGDNTLQAYVNLISGDGYFRGSVTALNAILSGNVGIGTTSSPAAKLEIQDGHLRLYTNFALAGGGYAVIWASDAGGTNTSFATIEGVLTADGVRKGDIKFNTSNSGAPTEKMRITSGGNLLIGSPPAADNGARLQVSGTATFSGGINPTKDAKNTYGIHIRGSFYGAPRLQLYDLAVDPNAYMGLGVDMSGAPFEFSNYFPRTGGNGRWSVGSWAGDFGSGQYVSGYNEKLFINENAAQFNVALTVTSNVTVTNGAIQFSGSGSAPSTDPAIYRVGGLNDMVFSIGSTPRMTIKSGGNVLIGTTTDNGHKLAINAGGTSGLRIDVNSGVNGLSMSPGAEFNIDKPGVGGGTFKINSSGNVGIGTPSPATKLSVYANNPTTGIIFEIFNNATSSQTGAIMKFTQESVADWGIGQPAGTNAFAFWSGTYPGNLGTERLRITSSGNLLVGTTTDNGARLQVSGTATVAGKLTISGVTNNNFQSNRSGTSAHFQTWYEADGTTRRGYFGYGEGGTNNFSLMNEQSGTFVIGTNSINAITLASTGAATFSSSVTANGAKPQLYVSGDSGNGAGIHLTTALSGSNRRNWGIFTEENIEGDFAIKSSSAAGGNPNLGDTRFLITSSGNVLIGTTTDVGAKLHVDGGKSLVRTINSSWGQFGVANPNDGEVGIVWGAGGTGYPGITSTYTRQWIAGLSPFGTGMDRWSLTNRTLGANTALTIRDDGDTGIGTNSPASRLHLYKAGDYWHFIIDGGTGQLRFGAEAGAGAVIQARTSGGTTRPLYLQRDGGNVLIGTTTDNGNKLRVNGNSWFDGEVAVNAITCTSGNTNTYINPIGTLGIIYSGQGTSAVHQFLVNSGERFAVTNSGIRTISPSVGTNAIWKLGNVFTLSGATQNRIVRVEIDGTMYNLLAYA